MDTVTQMLLGATVAQAGFRRRLGRRAIVAGAVIGLLPDLDVAAGWIGGPFANWVHHRGLTHSLLFGPLAGLLLGWLIWRWHRRRHGPDGPWSGPDALPAWCGLALLSFMTHPIIDIFTSYGTQWLYPLTDFRFAVNAMPIIDPIYSLALAGAVAVGLATRRRIALARGLAAGALYFITVYTLGAWAINGHVEAVARAQVGPQVTVTAYPTLFQPVLRRVVAETGDAVLVGFHSALSDRPIQWERFPRTNSPAIQAVAATPEAGIFRWFAMDKLLWQETPLPGGGTMVQALDYRYGLPGAPPGLWGIRATVTAAGTLAGPVESFQTPRDTSAAAWSNFWARLTGQG